MLYLIQPPRQNNVFSGGYRYNEEVGRRLQASGAGELLEVLPAELERRLWELSADRPDSMLVLDSAYLPLIGAPSWLERLASLSDTWLLMHYVPSQNPRLLTGEVDALQAIEHEWVRVIGGVLATSERTARTVHGMSTGDCVHMNTEVVVARPGVDDFFHPDPDRSDGGARTNGVRTVISVGALRPEKGQAELAKALRALAKNGRKIRLVLVGDHQQDPTYTTQVREAAGDELALELVGAIPPCDVAVRLRDAAVYASASVFESYGMATREAVASGVPVVSYRIGEAEDWIVDGKNGFLIDVDDAEGLESSLARALDGEMPLGSVAGAPRSWDETTRTIQEAAAPSSGARSGINRRVALYSSCDLPTEYGDFQIKIYQAEGEGESILILKGDLSHDPAPFIRVHSECYTGEVLGSLKCDCRAQLEDALRRISTEGRGGVIYLRQEGRGIGLGNKIRAYAEQAKGADTVEANKILGFPVDLRDFRTAARILQDNGCSAIRLNTNNPAKVSSLRANGIEVRETVPSATRPNPHNVDYLQTKYKDLGHQGLGGALRVLDDGA